MEDSTRLVLGQLLRSGVVIRLRGISGDANPSDIFTKHLKNRDRWLEYVAYLYNVTLPELRKLTGQAKAQVK